MEQMRTWLSSCLQTHTQCDEKSQRVMPSRVLDVGSNHDCPHIRLQATGGQTGAYIALSYCWGTPTQPKTTKDNLAMRESRIALEELPQTIQDAVKVTRNLGVQYLWVDALCIIQDDEQDIRAQIGQMGNIYKNALLTISATSCRKVTSGFLHKRRLRQLPQFPIYLSKTQSGTVRLATERGESLEHEPLHLRGWATQEYCLSRRMLLFAGQEVLWRCATEPFLPIVKSHLKYRAPLPNPLLEASSLPAHAAENGAWAQHEYVWSTTVTNYSSCGLSEPVDRARALVGIAKELSALWNDAYLLGSWANTFIGNLHWVRALVPSDPRWSRVSLRNVSSGKRVVPALPSWSWLALQSPVLMFMNVDEDATVAFPVREVPSMWTREDYVAQDVEVRINARVVDAAVLLADDGAGLREPNMDLDEYTSIPPDAFVALIGYQRSQGDMNWASGLVLRAVRLGVFERIGSVRTSSYDWSVHEQQVVTLV